MDKIMWLIQLINDCSAWLVCSISPSMWTEC